MMKWTENLAGRFGANAVSGSLKDALAAGRTARFAEDYTNAIAHFSRASELATAAGNRDAAVSADMARAECLIQLARYEEAAVLIEAQYRGAQNDTQRGLIVLRRGILFAAQGEAARTDYELALRHARSVKSDELEGRALGELGAMYLAEGNASYASHLLRDAVSKINAAGEVDNSSRIVGLLGQSLVESGQDVEGQHLIERALTLAENMGSRADERQWATILGKRAAREGRFQDAKGLYGQALPLFNPDMPTAAYVMTLCELSKVCLSLREMADALGYAQTAVRAAEKVNVEAVTRAARGTLGVVLRVSGKHEEAIPHLEAASAAEPIEIDVLRSLAAAQANSGEVDSAIKTYQRAITAAEKSPLELALVRRDLGLAYHKLGDLQEAIHEWSLALAIYEERKASAQTARLLCDTANARKALGHYARAMKDYETALMVLNSVDENDLETRGLVLSNAANAYAELGDAESADAFFNEAIQISDRLGDKVGESTRAGNYGWFLLNVGRPRRAMSTIERALQLSREQHMLLHTAVQTDNLGLVYDALADYPTALDYHQQALNQLIEINQPYWIALARINMANTLIALAQIDKATELLEMALKEGRSSGRIDVLISALTGLAQAAIARLEVRNADIYLSEAITLARKYDQRRLLAEALSARSRLQAQTGQPAEAVSAWEEAHKLYTMLHMPQAKIQPAWLSKEKDS